MSDTASSSHSPLRPDAIGRPGDIPGQPNPGFTSPEPDDQPTVISNRPPLAAPGSTGPEATHPLGQVATGAVFGHFRIVEFVGGGGMGRVYRAVDSRLDRTVALKVLSPQQATDEETVLRFQNEARSVARLNHPGIVQIFDVGQTDGMSYIALEFVEGQNLRMLIERRGVLSLQEAISYTLQVAEALDHANRQHVVHRDIKPSNILVAPSGRTKLIDMGLARISTPQPGVSELTATGVTLGTFDYISPEQARDPRSANVASDIYSLGCTLFYMLAGRPPFPEGTVLQKLLQHQGEEPPDVRDFRPDIPEDAARVLRRMMAKEPRGRYRDPRRLIAALHALANQIGLQPVGPGGMVWVVPAGPRISRIERHLRWAVPTIALIACVLLMEVFGGASRQTLSQWRPVPLSRSAWEDSAEPPTPVTPNASQPPDSVEPLGDEPGDGTLSSNDHPTPGPSSNGANVVPVSPDTTDSGTSGGAQDTTTDPAAAGQDDPSSPSDPPGPSVGDVDTQSAVSGAEDAGGGHSIVDPSGTTPGAFDSLAEACESARADGIIELRYNGRRSTRPLSLGNRRLTLRAGEGYRPVLQFAPSGKDPARCPRSMILLEGGRLELIDLAIELDVPRNVPTERWSLVELGTGSEFRMQHGSMTVRNARGSQGAYHHEVHFFRVQPSAGSVPSSGAFVSSSGVFVPSSVAFVPSMAGPEAPVAVRPASIHLEDCVARGEAVFLRAETPTPVQLVWHNGLLVTHGRLIEADGGEVPPALGASYAIEMDHVTAIVRGGLARLGRGEFTPFQLRLPIRCTQCVLVASPSRPLVEQLGVTDLEVADGFEWAPDGNRFDSAGAFHVIRSIDPDIDPIVVTLDEWRQTESADTLMSAEEQEVPWAGRPGADRPLHAHGPADYALELSDTDPLEPVAGCQADLLPPLQ